MKRTALTMTRLAALFALGLALSGCMSFHPRSLREMESALRESNPGMDIKSATRFGVGALTMNFVDFAFVHEGSADISKLSRADIGIYELKEPIEIRGFQVPQSGDRNCPRREVILRIMEEDEHVEMAVCIRDDKITGFTMFVLEPTEIVVINTRGDLQALVSAAIRDNSPSRRRMAASNGAGAPGSDSVDVHEHVDIRTDLDRDIQRPARAVAAGAPQS